MRHALLAHILPVLPSRFYSVLLTPMHHQAAVEQRKPVYISVPSDFAAMQASTRSRSGVAGDRLFGLLQMAPAPG